MNNPDKQDLDLIEKFSFSEKIFLRIAFYGVIVIGAYGIYSESSMCKNKSVPFFFKFSAITKYYTFKINSLTY